jgi:hypothetical protein
MIAVSPSIPVVVSAFLPHFCHYKDNFIKSQEIKKDFNHFPK